MKNVTTINRVTNMVTVPLKDYNDLLDTAKEWESSRFILCPTEDSYREWNKSFEEVCSKRLEPTKKPPVKFKYKPIITENTKEITGILFGTVYPEYKIYNKVRLNSFVTHFNEPYYKY